MISQLPPTASDSAPLPEQQPRGQVWYRWIDRAGGLLLLAAGILALYWSPGPHYLGQFLIALALILAAFLDLRHWLFEGSRRPSLSRWLIVLWVPVFLLFLAGALVWHLGY